MVDIQVLINEAKTTSSQEKMKEFLLSNSLCLPYYVRRNPNVTEEVLLLDKSLIKIFFIFSGTIYQQSNSQMKLNITLFDNFQDNLKTVSELTKEDVSSEFFQTPFFRRWFVSQDLTELVPFYLVSNYISNVNYLNKVWSEIPFDIFQNYQDILMKFELYSTPDSAWNWMRDNLSYQSYLHMISHFYGEEGFQRTLDIYNDTVNQLNKLSLRRMNEMEKITKPKRWRLQEFHDHMSHLYLEATTENRKHPTEFIPFPVQKDSWKVYEPKDTMDLTMWGRRVRNCVMSYEDKIFRKQSAIVLIEENEKPTYTAELDYKSLQEGRIEFKQLVGLTNRSSDLDEEKRNIVSNLIESAIKK